ncbi:phage baseplate assembly protein [Paraburkholderia adhaesiva]|uniref:phage baseplate assembly protein n=1 Tax=Paraburkholderia adhaesiva TaxID=2883244 RepID=UPI001F1D8BE5|nr:hypothetical protein [Paraburkholderia adhaesiva]
MADTGIAELKIGGTSYGGWTDVTVEAGIEQISGAFKVGVTDRWADQPVARPIRPDSAVQLLLDGDPVVTGWVDEVNTDADDRSHSMQIDGRDRTCDLVDCSAIYKTGQWRGVTLERIVRDLVAPYDITVTVNADVGATFPSFNLQEGETVFQAMDRAARMRAVLLTSDSNGGLLLTRAANAPIATRLVFGENIKKIAYRESLKERFSEYRVKGQGKGNMNVYGKAVRGYASATDSALTRYRPLIILSEKQAGQDFSLQQRIDWERDVRIGRGTRVTITVQGWSHADGLWRPNTLVSVQAPEFDISDQLLIAKIRYLLNERTGTTSELELADPRAFALLSGVSGTSLNRAIRGADGVEVRRRNVANIGRHKRSSQ